MRMRCTQRLASHCRLVVIVKTSLALSPGDHPQLAMLPCCRSNGTPSIRSATFLHSRLSVSVRIRRASRIQKTASGSGQLNYTSDVCPKRTTGQSYSKPFAVCSVQGHFFPLACRRASRLITSICPAPALPISAATVTAPLEHQEAV